MERNEVTEEQIEKDQRSCSFPLVNSDVIEKREDKAVSAQHDHQRKHKDQRCLLDELARIEQDLKESIHREETRERELHQVRREENRIRWGNLTSLRLNQRTTKPWVTSYYKNIPMHIYCLPIESVVTRQDKKLTKR